MKKTFRAYSTLVLIYIALVAFSCKEGENNPQPEDTSKVTGLTLQLDTNLKGHLDATAMLQDVAGINGKSGDVISLNANGSYTGTLVLSDATKTPTATVTNDYTITYQISGVDASISAAGPTPTITTRVAGSGTLRIIMVKGDKTTSVTFPLTIR